MNQKFEHLTKDNLEKDFFSILETLEVNIQVQIDDELKEFLWDVLLKNLKKHSSLVEVI